jgi:hypothetical protein
VHDPEKSVPGFNVMLEQKNGAGRRSNKSRHALVCNFVTRLSNLLGRFGFKVFIHAFQDALPTGKSLSPDESEGTELLWRLPRPAIPGDGRMGLSAQLAFFEVRALVFFVSQQDFQVQMQIDCLSGGNLHKKFSR